MSDPFVAIVAAAAELKRSSPVAYEIFVRAMQAYAERAKNDLLAADKKVIFPAQGKANTLAQLATKLDDCFRLDEQFRAAARK